MPLESLGPYRLEKLLGRGGMGAVYAAVQKATGQRAAIKLLSVHLADDTSFRERFKQEIETLKRLLHPNIVQLHGYGEEDGYLYFVMEMVEGRSLQEELTAGRRFEWREVVRIGIAIAQALKHAHDRGIIHRDLKPANLLIDAQDHIKLTDFGIAKLYGGSNVTADGGVLGTADYMAPEQAAGKPVTGRCDLYSLGSVLYALLAGRPPFGGRTVVEVVTALQKDTPVPVRRLAPETPAEFERIIAQLLEKDPQKRIPTAQALTNRLKAMEFGLSLETRVHDTELDLDGDAAQGAEDSPSAAKTEISGSHSHPTAPLEGDAEYRLANDEATLATGPLGAAAPAAKTRLSTQAGQGTGVHPASAAGTDASGSRRAANGDSSPAPAKVARFTTVTQEELIPPREADDSPLKQWLLAGAVGGIGLVVIAAAVFFATRPPSADRLYGVIEKAADPQSPDELWSVEAEMKQFVQLFPHDPRAAAIQQHLEELEQQRHEKQLARKSRRGEPGAVELSPAERAYQQALQLANLDPAAALARLEALVAVYGDLRADKPGSADRPENDPILARARQQIQRLRPVVEKLVADEKAVVERRLAHADQLVAGGDRQSAAAIWRGIVTLYADKPWAKQYVERAEQRLAELAAKPAEATARPASTEQ